MLNFQIRGYSINLNIGSVNINEMNSLMEKIRIDKCSLAQIMFEKEWSKHTNIYSKFLPIISEQTELIVTSFTSSDYYEDGYSFFRTKVNELAQIPEAITINFPSIAAIIVNKIIYFGCSFEAESKKTDHSHFDKNNLSISTLTTPLYQNNLVNEVFLNDSKLYDLNRKKHEMVQFSSSIYTNSKFKQDFELDSFDFNSTFSRLIESKIDFKKQKK